MNKTFCRKKYLLYLLIAGCLILFNTGCGLDTFYVIDSPNVYHEPLYSSIEESESYFEFNTVEKNYEGIKFLGTEVYYKIYDNTSRLVSEYSNINQAASNESTANQSADRLIVTYKYQALRSSADTGANVLIPNTLTNKRIKIRLSNYYDYKAEFTVDGTTNGFPVRDISKNPSFSFKELSSDLLPKGGENADADYAYSSSSDEIKDYYVCLFAVAVAQDATYSRLYSNAVYLGSVKISREN